MREDGTPVDPGSYDYRRAARDAVHFAALVDRWWQNLRRVVGWDVQYFATVEPQKRCAPHLHAAIRGSVPHEVLRAGHRGHLPPGVVAGARRAGLPRGRGAGVGGRPVRRPRPPASRSRPGLRRSTRWRSRRTSCAFGRQVHSKGILGGTEEAGRHIGYLTKYLTKSTGEVIEADTDRQRAPP